MFVIIHSIHIYLGKYNKKMSVNNNHKKLNVCIICGGRSGEHEVSLLSARSVYKALDKEKYNITLVGIGKNGHWHVGDLNELIHNGDDPKSIKLNTDCKECITTTKGDKAYLETLKSESEIAPLDVVLPVMHGTYGEDGCIQGFLELLNVAYVGCDVLGSAVGMDKDVMKRLLRDAGLPVGKFFSLREHELSPKKIDEIINELKFPIFVKPANLGSSVGISKCHNEEELKAGIKEATKYDMKLIFEEYIEGREIEVSVLGNHLPVASLPGEVILENEFYDYEAKYESGSSLEIPAKLDKDMITVIQELAIKTFEALNCTGMARVDFFLKEDGRLIISELNSIPGFTDTSMFPRLWEAEGIPFTDLLDKLINLALETRHRKDKLKRSYM
jgi:D-alanine-D-alanine ligase